MTAISVNQVLLLVFWFASAMLIFILALIARFYETSTGQLTWYRLYIVPLLLMGGATARYVSVRRWGGDWLGDFLTFVSGAFLLVLCMNLYRQMTYRRK